MKFGEDLRMSIRSIVKRYIETILLLSGVGLGVGVTAAGIAMAARSARDARELLSSPQYRDIVVTVREDAFTYNWQKVVDREIFYRAEVIDHSDPDQRAVRAMTNPIYIRLYER